MSESLTPIQRICLTEYIARWLGGGNDPVRLARTIADSDGMEDIDFNLIMSCESAVSITDIRFEMATAFLARFLAGNVPCGLKGECQCPGETPSTS